jgi:hypothetical protein
MRDFDHLLGDGEPERNRDDKNLHRLGRSFEGNKQEGGCLHEQPTNHHVGGRDLINVAPFQFGEEILWIHFTRLDEALVTGRTLR